MSARLNYTNWNGFRKIAVALLVTGLALGNTTAAVAQQGVTESRIIRVSAQPGGLPQRLSLSLNKAAILELDRDARDGTGGPEM